MSKQKLELTWIGKENQPILEPRILIEDPEKSYGDQTADNMLIYGDNLLALKALEQDFAGKVKCVYIDPPFNTQQAFEHYDDGLEHSIWLRLIRDRLEIVKRLISQEGTLFVHIDDNELGYLIVLLDEVMGRSNRISIITFKQGSATGHKSINPGVVNTSNFIIIYAKNKALWKPNRIFTARAERDKRYGQFIANYENPFSEWRFITLSQAFATSLQLPERGLKKALGSDYEEKLSQFVADNAIRVVRLARPDYNAVSSDARAMIDVSKAKTNEVMLLTRDGYSDMYFVGGERILFYSDKLKLIDGQYMAGEPLTSIWDDVLSNNLHNEGAVEFPKGKKPEALIKRCVDLVTNPGDLIFDSFLGSGTTAAVAHKMNRRWIGIELGDHCHTHCLPRLKKVVDGTDQGGISKAVNWKGGGGFKYYYLAPSLLKEDKYGNWIIDKRYNADMLAAAMSKHEGFKYSPDAEVYWKQGRSTEKDYIFTTTQFVTIEFLDKIHEEMKPDESLLICSKSFSKACETRYANITVRKIPNMLLGRCEFGREDYSLNIINMPVDDNTPDFEPPGPDEKKQKKAKTTKPNKQMVLFEDEDKE